MKMDSIAIVTGLAFTPETMPRANITPLQGKNKHIASIHHTVISTQQQVSTKAIHLSSLQ